MRIQLKFLCLWTHFIYKIFFNKILEEVCKKQGYKSEEYDLRHHNHIIDTQTILRFSGLPNNAMLEMSEAVKIREESDVVLGVQLEDGIY